MRHVLLVPLALVFLWAFGAGVAAGNSPSFELVRLTRKGELRDPEQLKDIARRFAKEPPTHILVLAHGWNNTEEEARKSYTRMVELLDAQAESLKLRSAEFRPAYIGLHWPSLAFEGSEELAQLLLNRLPDDVKKKIKPVLQLRTLPKRTVLGMFKGVREFWDRESGTPDGDNLDLTVLDRGDVETLLDAARIFSFWQMKKRSGAVGEAGARQVLETLQNAAPKSQFHLIGHSFGCKLWLAALAGEKPLPRPVDSLVLLQGAVSSQAFLEKITVDEKDHKGGYHHIAARPRVRGPIVATFTDRDLPLRRVYPLGSRAAGHVGEMDLRARDLGDGSYRSMGGWGIEGSKVHRPRKPGDGYGFKAGLHSIDANGSKALTSHSDFYTPEVAWLIWSAALGK